MILIILGEFIAILALWTLFWCAKRDLNEAVRALDNLLQMTSRSPYADYGDYAIERAREIVRAHYDIQ